jgi:hypothetical protein
LKDPVVYKGASEKKNAFIKKKQANIQATCFGFFLKPSSGQI